MSEQFGKLPSEIYEVHFEDPLNRYEREELNHACSSFLTSIKAYAHKVASEGTGGKTGPQTLKDEDVEALGKILKNNQVRRAKK